MAKKAAAADEGTRRKRGRPATGETPLRHVRIADALWKRVEAAALAAGENTSEWVRRVLDRAAK